VLAGRRHLGVIEGDRRGADHHIGALHVLRPMPDGDPNSELLEMPRHLRRLEVGSGDDVLHVVQDFGDAAHPGAPDPHEMDMPVPLHHH